MTDAERIAELERDLALANDRIRMTVAFMEARNETLLAWKALALDALKPFADAYLASLPPEHGGQGAEGPLVTLAQCARAADVARLAP